MASPSAAPEAFTRAVAGLRAATPRPEILIEEIAAPQRLAPFAFSLSATVLRDGEEVATGRLILLHEPSGHDSWQGDLRLVTLVTAELESDMAGDPLLPAVAWTWLADALEQQGAAHTAIGGDDHADHVDPVRRAGRPGTDRGSRGARVLDADHRRSHRPPARLVHHAGLDRGPAAARRHLAAGPAASVVLTLNRRQRRRRPS